MAVIPSCIVRLCCDYARLKCDARRYGQTPGYENHETARRMLMAAYLLYQSAPAEATTYLEAVHQVLLLEPTEQDVGRVLLRASLLI